MAGKNQSLVNMGQYEKHDKSIQHVSRKTPTILLLPIDPKQELHTHTHTHTHTPSLISTRFGHTGVGGCVILAFLFSLRRTKKGDFERERELNVCAFHTVAVCVAAVSLTIDREGAPAKFRPKKWLKIGL